MKQNVNFSTFQTAFESIRPDNFSYEGLSALYDYLIQYEDDMNEELELDVIALCCDFSQCSLKEFKESFTDVAIKSDMTDEEKQETISEFIEMYGSFYAFVEDGKEVIFQNF